MTTTPTSEREILEAIAATSKRAEDAINTVRKIQRARAKAKGATR